MNVRIALLLAVSSLPLSSAPAPQEDPAAESEYFRVQRELEGWRAQHGESWRVVYESRVGHARFLYGGSAQAPYQPRGDREHFELARFFLTQSAGLHGVQSATLVDDHVVFLPLGLAGSTDKLSVRFRQEIDGVPVVGATVNLLFDTRGRLLSLDSSALPGLLGMSTRPDLDAGEALGLALAAFGAQTGLPATSTRVPRLVFGQLEGTKLAQVRLAWETQAFFESEGSAPEGWRYHIDAVNGDVLSRRRAVHHLDVSGQVRSMATPGVDPDTGSNPEVSLSMPHLRVSSSQGNAVTDSNGNFTIPGASAPLSVTVTYEGTYAATNNDAGADYSLTTTLNSASGNTVLMNPGGAGLVTAEANALNWIGLMRDWTRAVNPADPTSDFLAPANVNLNDTCNAYFNGVSVNFYQPGSGCVNTAYSSVVLHEMGHWLNVKYGSGNGSDGFGEGNADVFSMYILDDPIVGKDFCGSGCHIRTGENTRQYCGDCCGGCYGQVHADGEVLGGALWKVRSRLKAALGTSAGGAIADGLFNAWMNAYDDGQIHSIIEIHWLTLDDDDGNIDNGTPHFAEIDGGFTDQGFPGYTLPSVVISNVTQLPDTLNETGPYTVDADITAAVSPPVTSPTLFWRVNLGAWQSQPMAATGGDGYRADIPGQVSPAKVDYYVEAENAVGASNTFPAGAPAAPLKFLIGVKTVFFSEDFEGGTAGWTHAQASTQDDWQRSADVGLSGSAAKSGDPANAYSGNNIWGNDLGPGGWNGAYSDNVVNWLRSPAIDLSAAVGSTLRFQRWLTVEQGIYDRATVRVDGIEVWANPTGSDLIDSAWTETEIDIAAQADGKSNVVIEFRLESDGGVTFGGWNLDDIEVMTLDGSCAAPTATNPSSQTVCAGDPVTFATTAGGSGPFSYQWTKNGGPLSGATAASYTIPSVAPSNAGSYSVVVTGACGFVQTAAALLSVDDPVSASTPASASVCVGDPASFSTVAGGSGPFAYQWNKDGVPIAGATSSALTIGAVAPGDAGAYTVDVSGACGTLTSGAASLVVNSPVSASAPQSATACPGDPVSFSTSAGGTGPFSYQWKKGGSPIGGATSATFAIASVTPGDAGTYSVEVSGACGTLETAAATLTVSDQVTASTPASVTVCAGTLASFSTTAGGSGPFSYQWKKNGSPIGGATASSYVIAVTTPADAGSYTVEVTGACATVESGAALLAVDDPVSASAPASATVCPGAPVSFSTSPGGTGPFSYQWKLNGTPIAGATGASHSIVAAAPGDAGAYTVEVTGACGSVESAPATLTLNEATTASNPASAAVCSGAPASFATSAGGSGPFSYQWKKDGSPIAGANSSALTIGAVTPGDAGAYSVEVSGACGTVESAAATLTVELPPTASAPLDVTACPGDLATFSTVAGGSGPFGYQWKKDGVALPGQTSASLAILPVSAGDAGVYSVEVSGACGTVESAGATLSVDDPVTASAPLGDDVCLGAPVTFSTSAGGSGPFSYQWKKDGSPIGGANGSSFTIGAVTPGDAGSYSVEVSGACGSVAPAAAALTVLDPLTASAPLDVQVCVGAAALFDTTAGGSGPFSYQWKKDGNPIAGATAASLLLSSVTGADAGAYSVVVSGACGTLETAAATLSVSGVTVTYCTAKLNSQGCITTIGFAGVPSATAGSGYHVSASDVIPNTNGLFFYSTSGPDAVPFQGGFLCVAAPALRTAGQNSGGSGACGGAFDFDFNAHIALGNDPALVSGAQFWGQIWSRDPNSPSTTNLTDALTSTICP